MKHDFISHEKINIFIQNKYRKQFLYVIHYVYVNSINSFKKHIL